MHGIGQMRGEKEEGEKRSIPAALMSDGDKGASRTHQSMIEGRRKRERMRPHKKRVARVPTRGISRPITSDL